jgi:hypothetical protein
VPDQVIRRRSYNTDVYDLRTYDILKTKKIKQTSKSKSP